MLSRPFFILLRRTAARRSPEEVSRIMVRYGFIHTKEDIKFLVLFAMDLLPFPVTFETVVDLITWCDDGAE